MLIDDYKNKLAKLFKEIEKQNEGKLAVEEIASVLGLEHGAAYKRMNGTTQLKFNELYKLCDYFNLSFDELFLTGNGKFTFNYDLINKKIISNNELLTYLLSTFDSIKNAPGNTLIFHSRTIPFMHYFSYPVLFQLKMMVWRHTSLMSFNSSKNQVMSLQALSDQEIEYMQMLAAQYYNHPIIEIWGAQGLENIYSQIKYFVLANIINDESFIRNFCDSIGLLINHLKHITNVGVKVAPFKGQIQSGIKVYINELGIGSPMAYNKSGDHTRCILLHDTPNFIYTDDKEFCEYGHSLLTKIISYSTSISGEGSRERLKFFNKQEARFKEFQEEIYRIYEYAKI